MLTHFAPTSISAGVSKHYACVNN